MKTKVRIQKYNECGVDRISLQVIEHHYKNFLSADVVGFLHFSKFNDHFTFTNADVKSDNFSNFSKMGKIVKLIKENTSFDSDIKEVCNVLDCEYYQIFRHNFVRVMDAGKNMYNLVTDNGVYTQIVSANEITAQKYADRNYKNISATIELLANIDMNIETI